MSVYFDMTQTLLQCTQYTKSRYALSLPWVKIRSPI